MTWNLCFFISLSIFACIFALDDTSSGIASSLIRSGRNTSSTSLYSSRNQSLSIPEIPLGFSIDIEHHDLISLRPLGLYVTAVEAMYILSLLPWDALAPHPYTFNVRPYREVIHFEPVIRDGQRPKMRHSYMVIGLYVAVLGTADRFGHGFVAETTTLKLWDHPIGTCTIYLRPSAASELSSANVSSLSTSSEEDRDTSLDVELKAEIPTTSMISVSDSSGSFLDPDDPRVRVHWRFRFLPLASRDVLLAILDGLSLAAKEDANDLCRELASFSETPERKVAITVSAVRGSAIALDLTYRYAARTLVLISRLMVRLGKYDEMVFWVEFDGARFVLGDVMRRED